MSWLKEFLLSLFLSPSGSDDNLLNYFSDKELSCKQLSSKGNCGCGGECLINIDARKKLNKFRSIVGVPFSPNSAYRCPIHNANIGGVKNSQHVLGKAFDIPIKGKMTRKTIHKVAKEAGFTGFGDYNSFVHIDIGRKRYWDNRT